jgi:hypothetical protein
MARKRRRSSNCRGLVTNNRPYAVRGDNPLAGPLSQCLVMRPSESRAQSGNSKAGRQEEGTEGPIRQIPE